MSIIVAENLIVEFPIYGTSARSLKSSALRAVTGGVLSHDAHDKVIVRALDDIGFSWKSGDRIGLVGHNGCGKTTLLRTLTGAYEPSGGKLLIQGSVASMLSITLGMEGDATGIENIYLRGTLIGLNKHELKRLVEEVTEFSELGNYIHMPMRTYSTGMMMRIAFGISTSITADIVLMDEWLSVGDTDFAEKAELRLQKLVDQAKILVIASHNSGLIEKMCNRVMHLEHGKIVSHHTINT
ncbi:MAG: ABC transporter ATP-binding protein [Proteobacteria bacterium]|nr:ABC transporter ATP-binding protein [Pseudomonadota bacterium]